MFNIYKGGYIKPNKIVYACIDKKVVAIPNPDVGGFELSILKFHELTPIVENMEITPTIERIRLPIYVYHSKGREVLCAFKPKDISIVREYLDLLESIGALRDEF